VHSYLQTELQWLQVLLGLFLVSSVLVSGSENNNPLGSWLVFLPAGFVYAFLSGLIGSIVMLNPFYLNYLRLKKR